MFNVTGNDIFSHICDGTDVQADEEEVVTYGQAPNAIDIPHGSLICPSYTDMGPTYLYTLIPTPPPFSHLLRHAGDTEDIFST